MPFSPYALLVSRERSSFLTMKRDESERLGIGKGGASGGVGMLEEKRVALSVRRDISSIIGMKKQRKGSVT